MLPQHMGARLKRLTSAVAAAGHIAHTSDRSPIPTPWSTHFYDLYDLYDLYDPDRVDGWGSRVNLHDLEHASWNGYVLHRSCTISHNGR